MSPSPPPSYNSHLRPAPYGRRTVSRFTFPSFRRQPAMNNTNLAPSPFILPDRLASHSAPRTPTILRFVKDENNERELLQTLRNDPRAVKAANAIFRARKALSIQKDLLRTLIDNAAELNLFEAVHDIQQRRLDNDFIPLYTAHPHSNTQANASPAPTVRQRGKRSTHVVLTPLSHRGGGLPSSSRMTSTPATNRVVIDLTTPSPEPPSTSQAPVIPPHMSTAECFKCRKIGHFSSYCPEYTCSQCNRRAPGHYSGRCPDRPRLPPPRYRDDTYNDFDERDFDYDFDDDAIANMTGEPTHHY
jgi:hypothetical protein